MVNGDGVEASLSDTLLGAGELDVGKKVDGTTI